MGVYKEFGDGWYEGVISEYSSEFSTTVYKIQYKDDSTEFYEADDDELAEIVENAAEPQVYPIGVEVYEFFEEDSEDSEEFGDGWYQGFITNFDLETRNYTVVFEADNFTEYVSYIYSNQVFSNIQDNYLKF